MHPVQRQVYPVLLSAATILAILACLRPHVGVELMALADPWVETDVPPPVPAASPSLLGGKYGIGGGAPERPSSGGRPQGWPASAIDPPAEQVGESVPYTPPQDPPPPDHHHRRGTAPIAAPNWWPDRPPLQVPEQRRGRLEARPRAEPAGEAFAESEPWPRRAAAPSRDPVPGEFFPSEAKDFPSSVGAIEPELEPWPRRTQPDRSPSIAPPQRHSASWAPRQPLPAFGRNRRPLEDAPRRAARGEDRPAVTVLSTDQALPGAAPITPDARFPVRAIPCEGAQIVARVGPHAILMSDVWVGAERTLAAIYHARKNDPEAEKGLANLTPEEIVQQRDLLIRARFPLMVKQLVESKLTYHEALGTLPEEGLANIEEQINRVFTEEQLPKLMEFFRAPSQRELDYRLMDSGTSVQRHRRAFLEQTLSQQWLAQQIKINEDVSHEEMRAYYEEHLADFETPIRARWEQISVRATRYPSREAARATLAQAGNRVLDGRPFAEVARQVSDGPTASQGGARDWTHKGSLVSEVLDRAVFGLPVGQLSPILDDGDSLHIVRVIEREGGRRTPFVEAQVDIRKEIRNQRNRVQQQAYIDRLRDRIPVWTILDDRPAPRAASRFGG